MAIFILLRLKYGDIKEHSWAIYCLRVDVSLKWKGNACFLLQKNPVYIVLQMLELKVISHSKYCDSFCGVCEVLTSSGFFEVAEKNLKARQSQRAAQEGL